MSSEKFEQNKNQLAKAFSNAIYESCKDMSKEELLQIDWFTYKRLDEEN